MKIGHIELFAADPLASKDFYANVLGFHVTAIQEEQFVWLKCGDAEILLRPGRGSHQTAGYQDASSAIVLYTDDLWQMRQALQARGLQFQGTDGSAGCLTFTDPDGHWFQLADPGGH